MSHSPAVRVTGLYKIFGRKPREAVRRLQAGTPREALGSGSTAAVIDSSFDVERGEIFVVMGLSGSGKSTLIRMLNGLVEPTAGSVIINDVPITGATPIELRAARRNIVSMVFQHFALLPHRSVLDNAAYALEVQGVSRTERRERARTVVKRVGLEGWEDKLPGELSGGMQQRVGLARALAADTEILLMDEAFSALDPLIRREMQEQLVGLQAEFGKTIIFITHDLNEAMFLGDRIAVMRDGRIVQVGTPEEILTDPANDYVAEFVKDVDRARVITAASVMQPVRAVISATAGPRAALRVMRELQTSTVFVVGDGRRFLGVVRDRDIMRLVNQSITDLLSIIESVDFVGRETALAELFEAAVESSLPVPVVDAEHRLLGVIPRVTLLGALGNIPPADAQIHITEPPSTVPIDLITETLLATADHSSFGLATSERAAR